ncbi:MAG: hypothetical protein NPIRA03_38700 [Nitrospirales bacterium]|nr:MAG: hypothetical protein NPIRA03_38700 [Nitrospirales bacterium]
MVVRTVSEIDVKERIHETGRWERPYFKRWCGNLQGTHRLQNIDFTIQALAKNLLAQFTLPQVVILSQRRRICAQVMQVEFAE